MERFQSRADTLHRRTRKGQAMHDVIPGFDYSHFPPPKLHPGTRTTIMDKINDWFSQDSKRKVLWLNGPAGVGKSTISREFSDRVGTQTLAALFFANQCHDHVEVVPTIALAIAFTTERYKAYIVEKIDTSSLVTEMSVEEQFHALITNPIGEESLLDSGGAYLILLDALELCRGRQTSSISDGHLAKAAQMQIISLIARFAVDYPSAPIKWVISSRPEEHLKAVFSHPAVQPSYRELHVPISDEEACGDVRLYLEAAFQSIRQSHHLPSHWPGSDKLKKVAEAASGLFLFARDVKDFIYRGDPAAQLEFVLSAIDGSPSIILFGSPFVNLDASYEHIMSKIPTNVLADTHKILGHLLLRELFISSNLFLRYSLCSTANILGLDQFAVYRALSELHSVLYIPSPELAHKENIRFPHPSFYLYLKDKTRSEHYSINLPEVNKYIWKRYSQILQEANQDVSRQRQKRKPVITLSWPLNGSKFEKQKWISGLLYEAKYHWAHFLIPQCLCSDKLISRSLAPVSLSDQERLDAVCSINFKNLIDGYFAEESGHIELFFAFLRGLWQSSRKVLEDHGLSEKVIFSGLRDSGYVEIHESMDQEVPFSKTLNPSESIDQVVSVSETINPSEGTKEFDPSQIEKQASVSSQLGTRMSAIQAHSTRTTVSSNSNDILSWTNQDPRESRLFNSWGVLYRFQTSDAKNGKSSTTLWRAISPNKEDRVAQLEWATNGGLGRIVIGKNTLPMSDLVREDPRVSGSRSFNGPDGLRYRWRPSPTNTDIQLQDANNIVVAYFHPTRPTRYQIGDVYGELHFIREAGAGTVMHPPIMDMVVVTAMLFRFCQAWNL
ncbi:hypothetical protein D9756_010415 [Leucocoprinus leucothites]|uniref:NACHT domain-containing protein n=1 Tax=Leucocoprinus leucothites TaxID=201217 RepID=A0A8H5FS64_9AGAR|nr:hypothetical protein D9756_010415 [Leucoagaricus leucothites]